MSPRHALLTAALTGALCSLAGPAGAATVLRIDAFGTRGATSGHLRFPAGVAVARDGTVLVSDTLNGRVQAFAPDGAPLRVIGGPGSTDGRFGAPQGIAVAPDGTLWVADNGRDRIQHFTAVGDLLGAFGSRCLAGDAFQGPCEGRFLGPEGVAVAPDGRLYVADTRNSRVQAFTPGGAFAAASTADLKLPEDVAVAHDGTVLVTDTANDRLRRLSSDLGSIADTIVLPRGWRQPVGLTVAPDGCAYTLEPNRGAIGAISPRGFAAVALTGTGLRGPQAIAAGPDGSLYVADSGHDRIVRFDDPTPSAATGREALPAGTVAPRLSRLWATRTLHPAHGTGCGASAAGAGRIGYRLTRGAVVTFTILRGGSRVARFVQYAGAGAAEKRFAGVVGGHRLPAGGYVVEAVARNAAGASPAVRAAFRVPAPRAASAATRACAPLRTTQPFAGVVIQINVRRIRARNVTCRTARRTIVAFFQTSTAPAGWRYTVHREGAGSHGRLFSITKPQSIDLWFTSKG